MVTIGTALAAAGEFLLGRQGADGTWRDFLTLAGEGVDWPTGYVAAQLHDASPGRAAAALGRAAAALHRSQHPDGGWGYHGGVPTDADSTAYALLFLARVDTGAPIAAAADCLLAHQDACGGGFPTYARPGPIRAFMGLPETVSIDGWCRCHLEVTAAAGRALAAAGRAEAALRAWGFVAAHQLPDGAWQSYWWRGSHYPTLQAVALALALEGAPGGAAACARARAWALGQQLTDGGWAAPAGREAAPFATALGLTLLALTGAEGSRIARGAACLARLQQADGGFAGGPILCIPRPFDTTVDERTPLREGELGTGVVIADQHRLYTTATCLAALALAARAT